MLLPSLSESDRLQKLSETGRQPELAFLDDNHRPSVFLEDRLLAARNLTLRHDNLQRVQTDGGQRDEFNTAQNDIFLADARERFLHRRAVLVAGGRAMEESACQ